ncbi:hypothetical protein [Shinella daejeonensis]|uniref:hypothetical protein n=1 Tax=Shinella daejeonensis TaxID=659017 RepID=UPI0020C79345|nr:hypothetical protein [Shinella daejeonensis]
MNDKQDFAAWRVQYRRAYHLLDTVIFEWRGRNATLRGFPGKWVAYSQTEWQEKSGLPLNAMKLEFFRLELDGLIERQPGSWEGFKPRTFIRPTRLALTFMGMRPTDHAKLGDDRPAKTNQTGHPKSNPKKPPKGQPNGEPHITSFPSSPSSPTNLIPHAHAPTGGKGSAGEDGKVKKKKLIFKKPVPKAPIAPPPDDDDVDAMIAAAKAGKRAKLLELFPVIPDAVKTVHPSHPKMWGDEWFKFSPKAQAVTHAKYKSYAENELAAKGKHGKFGGKSKTSTEWTDADEAEYQNAMAENDAWLKENANT